MKVWQMVSLMMLAGTVVGLVGSYGISHGWVPARYLLQPVRQDWARFKGRLPLSLANLVWLIGSSAAALSVLEPMISRVVPSPGVLLLQVGLVLAADDCWFYFMHRALHQNAYLYRKIHRIHHKAFAPLPLDYIHVHPLELMGGAVGMVAALCAVGLLWGELSVATLLTAAGIRQLHELHVHTGIRAIFLGKIPLLGTVDHHDLHHAKPNEGNYATALTLWDRLLHTASDR